jgi:hypothetical protein
VSIESIRGTSEYLAPGTQMNVIGTLDEPLAENDTLFAMAHLNTNGNEADDFLTGDGRVHTGSRRSNTDGL